MRSDDVSVELCNGSFKSVDSDASNLDLTGSPLKVDLHSNDTYSSTFIFDRPNNWTDEEVLHYPIILKQARYVFHSIKNKN